MLSPDIFPLYRDESDNSILPLPNVMEKVGFEEKDRDDILELIMDMTGVNSVVDDTLNMVNGLRRNGLDTDLVDMTSLIDQVSLTFLKLVLHKKSVMYKKISYVHLQINIQFVNAAFSGLLNPFCIFDKFAKSRFCQQKVHIYE